jgi:hypothetical protein
MKREKVKLKHIMGLWKHLPGYPTEEDLVYEISVFLAKDGRPNGEFTRQTLKSAFGKTWETDGHLEVWDYILESGRIQKIPGKDASKDKFRILNNPYYENGGTIEEVFD